MIIYKLSEKNRKYFKVKIGLVIYDSPPVSIRKLMRVVEDFNPPFWATVGDVVSINVYTGGLRPNLMIIDLKTQRRDFTVTRDILRETEYEKIIVDNPPSTITMTSLKAIKHAIRQKFFTVIQVNGEEDMLTLPLLLLSPLRSIIVYGFPNEGLVVSIVSKYLKRRVKEIALRTGFPLEMLINN